MASPVGVNSRLFATGLGANDPRHQGAGWDPDHELRSDPSLGPRTSLSQNVEPCPHDATAAPGETTVRSAFADGLRKASYFMNLEWVPWPPNAVMDAARLGSIGLASHHLHRANQAALAVWNGCKGASPRIRLRTRARAAEIARELALGPGIPQEGVTKAVDKLIEQGLIKTARPARIWNPLSWFRPSKANLIRMPGDAKVAAKISDELMGRALRDTERLKVVQTATREAAEVGLKEGKHFAARLLPGLAEGSSVLGWIGRQSARFTGTLQFIFSCHDMVRGQAIQRDPNASKMKRLLAHITSLMSGVAVLAPLLPIAYRWPIITATAAIGAVTGTARDMVK